MRAATLVAITLMAAIPALFTGCWYYWEFGGTGAMPARAVVWLFIFAGLGLAAACLRARPLPAWSWRDPLPWLMLAVAWQGCALLWSPLPDPGSILVIERFLALALAVAVAAWQVPWWVLSAWALAILGGDLLALHASGFSQVCGPAAPFGNQNFNAAAVPLAVLGTTLAWRGRGRGSWMAAGLGLAAVAAAVVMGLPEPIGHGTRALWLSLAVGIVAWLALGLPRLMGPALLAAGAVTTLVVQGLCIGGALPVAWAGPSWEQRVWFWRASLRAFTEAPFIGLGPGGTLDALQRQPESCGHWLAVPSFAEHTHCEPLQVFLDGGVVNAVLLITGLVLTLLPLWRRRQEPAGRALLAAWAAVLAHSLAESHLSQPGALWCLALLAGVTWAWSGRLASPAPLPVREGLAVAGTAIATLAGWLALNDFRGGGTPPMLWRRGFTQADQAELRGDLRTAADALAEMRRRIGPLDDLAVREARLRLRLGEQAEAERLVALQLRRLPVVADAHRIGRWLARRRQVEGQAPGELEAALAAAEPVAREWLERIRPGSKNSLHLEALRQVLTGADPLR